MLLLPSLMTEKSFWKSELRLLTSNWTHLKQFFFNESDGRDILRIPDQVQIPIIRWRRKRRFCGKRSGCLVRIRRRVANLQFPSVLLANVQSLENKWDELKACISYQQDIKNCNILSWLNDDIKNIQLAGYTLYRQDRTAASGKIRCGGLYIFVNNSWCTISKEVSRFCLPEVEYIMIICRPHYLPREFSSVFFVAVYIPPQTEAGT